jgi:hypothetical protein
MKKVLKKTIAFSVAISLVLAVITGSFPVLAADSPSAAGGYVYISADINTLGDGFLFEPLRVPFAAGENWAQITDRFIGAGNYELIGTLTDNFYLAGITLPRNISVNVPQIIMNEVGALDSGATSQGQTLSQFDFTFLSGWMYTVNNVMAPVGAASQYPRNGDVCRWQFTIHGFGADLGIAADWGMPPLYDGADRSELVRLVARINSAPDRADRLANPSILTAYNNANAALTNLTAAQSQIDSAVTALNAAINAAPPMNALDISAELNAVLSRLVTAVPNPSFGTGAGEWTVLALARSERAVPSGYFEGYLERIGTLLDNLGEQTNPNSTASDHWVLNPDNGRREVRFRNAQSTENARLAVALSALGADASNFTAASGNTYDLIARMGNRTSASANQMWGENQGINGPMWNLIAINSRGWGNPYEITDRAWVGGTTAANPVEVQEMIDWLLAREIAATGGWSMSGAADPDITCMAIIALAPYRSQPAVQAAIDRALARLSSVQNNRGGFSTTLMGGGENSQSASWVIVALTTLGICPVSDSRFVKNGSNPVTALLAYQHADGGFRNSWSEVTNNSASNAMATDQAGYALVAYDRFVRGGSALFNMGDAFSAPPNQQNTSAVLSLTAPAAIIGRAGSAFNVQVMTSAFPSGDYKIFDGLLNIPEQFEVTGVTASSRLNGGSLLWNTDADDKLRFVYLNIDGDSVGISGADFPAELLTINLRVREDVDVPSAVVSVGGATLKEASDLPAFVFDTSTAAVTIAFTEAGISVRELFTGDGIDLIPSGRRAVAVTISDTPNTGARLTYKGSDLIYSPEMTARHGLATYVLFTALSETNADLLNFANYAFPSGTAAAVRFGDTDGNGIINAQDALDVVSAWLRITPVTADMQILTMNVNSDSRINTFDALAIVEHYISHNDFAIIGK